MEKNEYLSSRFTLGDLTVTSHKQFANMPDAAALANLKKLAALLDYLWSNVGPFTIASAYRSPELQAFIVNGGDGASAASMAATTSMHSLGEAADIVPTTMTIEQYFVKLFADDEVRKRLGQIVNKKEGGQNSLHVSIPTARFPAGVPMKVVDGQYIRLTTAEIQEWISKYPVAAAAGATFGVALVAALTFLLVRIIRKRKMAAL